MTKANYTGLILFVLLIIIIIGSYFLLKPQVSKVLELKSEAKEKKVVLSNKEKELSELEALKVNAQKTQDEIEEASKKLPLEKDIPSLLVQLEDIAKESNMKFTSININKEEGSQASTEEKKDENKKFATLSLEVQVEGSNSALKGYLDKIEKNIRILDIVSISTSSQEKLEEKGGIPYTLNMRTYYVEK